MIAAHSVADVRVAEHALMAQVPDGALMQRAATGLAVVCMRLLGRTTGSRVVLLVGGGDNGGVWRSNNFSDSVSPVTVAD